jgi:hypothetical protein
MIDMDKLDLHSVAERRHDPYLSCRYKVLQKPPHGRKRQRSLSSLQRTPFPVVR